MYVGECMYMYIYVLVHAVCMTAVGAISMLRMGLV